ERFGQFHHARLRLPDDGLAVPAQKVHQVLNPGPVLLSVHVADAGRVAQLDVEVQAGPLVLAGDVPVTGQVGEGFAQHVERFTHRPGRCVRPEVAAAVLFHAAGDFDLRVIHAPAHGNVWVTLVVLEADVEARPVLLDQVVFGVQRRDFAGHHQEL